MSTWVEPLTLNLACVAGGPQRVLLLPDIISLLCLPMRCKTKVETSASGTCQPVTNTGVTLVVHNLRRCGSMPFVIKARVGMLVRTASLPRMLHRPP